MPGLYRRPALFGLWHWLLDGSGSYRNGADECWTCHHLLCLQRRWRCTILNHEESIFDWKSRQPSPGIDRPAEPDQLTRYCCWLGSTVVVLCSIIWDLKVEAKLESDMHASVLTYNTWQCPFLKVKVLPLIFNVKFWISTWNDSLMLHLLLVSSQGIL